MKKIVFLLLTFLFVVHFAGCSGVFDDGDDSENYAKGLSLVVDKNNYTSGDEIILTLSGLPKFSKQFDISQLKKCSVRFSVETGSSPVSLTYISGSNSTFSETKKYSNDEKNNCVSGVFSPSDSGISETVKVKVSETGKYRAKCEINFLNSSGYYNSTLYSEEFTVE